MADTDAIPLPDCIEGATHPAQTPDLYGQEAAQSILIDALGSGRMHHAWLLSGPEGIGKATLAYRAARALVSGETGSLDMAQDHPVFQRIAAFGEPRLSVVRRAWDADRKKLKTQITVDEVRKLGSFFGLSATDGGWRVAIIDAADEMNLSAANALLKILEEPPSKAVLFLISHAPGRLLPTIKSRVRALSMPTLDEANFAKALSAQHVDAQEDGLHQLAEGSVGAAMALIHGDGLSTYQQIIQTLSDLPNLDRSKLAKLAEQASARGKEDAFEQIVHLTVHALSRMSKAAALGPQGLALMQSERPLFERLANAEAQARVWADTALNVSRKCARARAVNLDPANLILDTFFYIETAAKRL
jgi:DNA polymerase-3 subunit delta'